MDKDRPDPPLADDGVSRPSAELPPPAETQRDADPASAVGPFLDGRILIAMPAIGDPRFERTVLFVCVHNHEHAMAIVLNRPMRGLTVPSLLTRLGLEPGAAPEAPVLFGGPCQPERGYVLHTDDYVSSGSTRTVAEGAALTDTREVLDAIGDDARRPRRFALALGYAGWESGQLEREIQDGVWLTCEPDEELLFGSDNGEKWARALAKIGVTPERLSPQAGRA